MTSQKLLLLAALFALGLAGSAGLYASPGHDHADAGVDAHLLRIICRAVIDDDDFRVGIQPAQFRQQDLQALFLILRRDDD